MGYYETAGDLDEDWCGVTSDEQEAVQAAMEGREADLAELPHWELEAAHEAIVWCCKEHCRNHGDPAARDLLEKVLRQVSP